MLFKLALGLLLRRDGGTPALAANRGLRLSIAQFTVLGLGCPGTQKLSIPLQMRARGRDHAAALQSASRVQIVSAYAFVYIVDRRKKVLQLLGKAWTEFRESYAGLSEAEVLGPGVTGEWSVRDIIAHVTTWEEETLKHLTGLLQGRKYPRYSVAYGGLNAFNALMTANKKSFSLAEVFRQQEQVHGRLLEFLESVPEEHLDGRTRFRHRLRMDTYGHYPKHAQAIRKWRSRITN